MLYFAKTPHIIKRLFPNLTWDIPTKEKVIYLTFDDGPTPEITTWVLSELKKFNAKATFFCIGKNVTAHPEIFKTILEDGNAIGNHTHNHVNGWKKTSKTYLRSIDKAQETINFSIRSQKSPIINLFRPPYGKIKNGVAKKLLEKGYKIIMWDVLSGDFDRSITKEQCLKNVIQNTTQGSIVVFHDSVKASNKLKFVLPKALDHFSKKGYVFETIK